MKVMKMSDKKYKKILIIMIIIFLAAVPVLYFLSDNREQAVKEVENEFDIKLPASVKREREIKKEPSFHGDGEAAILFTVDKADIDEIKDELKDYEVTGDTNKVSQIESCFKIVRKKGFKASCDFTKNVYFKPTSDNVNYDMYGNFVAIIISEDSGEILFLQWDS